MKKQIDTKTGVLLELLNKCTSALYCNDNRIMFDEKIQVFTIAFDDFTCNFPKGQENELIKRLKDNINHDSKKNVYTMQNWKLKKINFAKIECQLIPDSIFSKCKVKVN